MISTFLFLTESIPFLTNFFQRIKNVCWSWNLEIGLIRLCNIWWCFLFFFSLWNRKFLFWVMLVHRYIQIQIHRYEFFFGVNLFQRFKIVSLSWNLVPRIFRICKTEWKYLLPCFMKICKFCQKCQFAILMLTD